MLCEQIVITSGELNDNAEHFKNIVDIEYYIDNATIKRYRPVSIKVINNSGDEIEFLPLSAREFLEYTSGEGTTATYESGEISDFIPVADSDEELYNNIAGEITNIGVKGAGTHTSGLTFIVIKE